MIIDLEPVFNNVGSVRDISYELDLSGESFEGYGLRRYPHEPQHAIDYADGSLRLVGHDGDG